VFLASYFHDETVRCADGEHGASRATGVVESPVAAHVAGVRDVAGRDAAVQELAFDVHTLATLRRLITAWAGEETLEREPTEELVLAVNELASNSIRHGGGWGRLRFWKEPSTLHCEVHDAGYIEDPFVGRRRPGQDALSGRGLWLVSQLCDDMQIGSSRAGTVVRVQKRLSKSA
jgi:anti-sigma regulatory factor (Ser/Thr protein kinase)